MADIMHLLRIGADPRRLYSALATPEGVRDWWTSDADLDLHVGGTGEFRFYGGERITRVRIEALDPPSLVAWRTIGSFRPEWTDTLVTFSIRPDAEGATLLFAHRNFPQADENYAICTTGWGFYLSRLKEVVEASS